MRSPHTSPSLRSIAHMHNRASYFPSSPPLPAPAASTHHPVSNMHQHQTYPVTSSPLASPRIGSPRPVESPRPAASRRPTYTSAIPIGYGPHPTVHHSPSVPTSPRPQMKANPHTQSLGDTRRRPSFRIDLPPRPAPAEILAAEDEFACSPTSMTGARFTPSKLPKDEVGAGRTLSLGPLEMTDMRNEIDNIAYQAHAPSPAPVYITAPGRLGSAGPTFRDPFAGAVPRDAPVPQSQPQNQNQRHEGGYMIIRAPTRRLDEDAREGSPKWRENDPFAGAVGLGYSLNRLRAPTPWVRKSAEDNEWLSAEDVASL
jgi:hypothetical protein